MKVLRNLRHDGKDYVAGAVLADSPFTQAQHDSLVADGIVSDDDHANMPLPVELAYQNWKIQEGDNAREKLEKAQAAANRAANVGAPQPPMPASSQVEQGTKADAEAAINKANQVAAQATPAVPAADQVTDPTAANPAQES